MLRKQFLRRHRFHFLGQGSVSDHQISLFSSVSRLKDCRSIPVRVFISDGDRISQGEQGVCLDPAYKEVIDMACPICKSDQFYVKDPSDPFETFEFKCRAGQIQFVDADHEDQAPSVSGDQEIYCQRCSWHGKITSVAEH